MEVEPPHDVYPLIIEMRRSFERIISILQSDEERIRWGYHLLQKERDAMGRELMNWHQSRVEMYPPTCLFTGRRSQGNGEGSTDETHATTATRTSTPISVSSPIAPERAAAHRSASNLKTSVERHQRPASSPPEASAGAPRRVAHTARTDDRTHGSAGSGVATPPNDGGAEVMPHHRPSPRCGDDVREVSGFSALARLPTNPPSHPAAHDHSGESSALALGRGVDGSSFSDDDKGDESGNIGLCPRTPALADRAERAAILSPQRSGSDRHYNDPVAPTFATLRRDPGTGEVGEHAWASLHDISEGNIFVSSGESSQSQRHQSQEEMRMYAAPVLPRPSCPRANSRGSHGLGGGMMSEPDGTLTESDCTTMMTNSSYQYRRLHEETNAQQHNAQLRALMEVARGGGGYAGQLPRYRDAATATREGNAHRGKLGLGSSSMAAAENVDGQGFWIHIWPCFGTFSAVAKPARVYVYGHCRRLEDVTEKASEMLQCRPAPQHVFEPDGKVVRTLRQLIPEQHYLLFPSGGFYREDAVPSALLHRLVQSAKTRITERSL